MRVRFAVVAATLMMTACGGTVDVDDGVGRENGGNTGTNAVPVANFSYLINGNVLHLDATASMDPDGDPLSYTWHLGNGDLATDVKPQVRYSSMGRYTVHLVVSDGQVQTSKTEVFELDASMVLRPVTAGANPNSGDARWQRGKQLYQSVSMSCLACHGADGQLATFKAIDPRRDFYQHSSTGDAQYTLEEYLAAFMPVGREGACVDDCAADIAYYIRSWTGVPPAPQPSPSASPAPSVLPEPTPPLEPSPQATPVMSPTPSPLVTPVASPSPSPVVTPTPVASVANGRRLYESAALACATCHGADGRSPAPAVFPNIDPMKERFTHPDAVGTTFDLATYIDRWMPTAAPSACDTGCARDIAAYIRSWSVVSVPTPSPSPLNSPLPTPTRQPSPTPVASPAMTPTPLPSAMPTPSPTATASPQPSPVQTPTPTPSPSPVSGNAANGKILYESAAMACISCHGRDGTSPAPAVFPSIDNGKSWFVHSTEPGVQRSLADYIQRFMPTSNVGSCNAQCAADIAAYIKTWLPDSAPVACDDTGIHYGRRMMRLLTAREYQNSIEDLVGYRFDAQAAGVPRDTSVEGFANQVFTAVTQAYADAYGMVARQAAAYAASQNFAGVVNCANSSASACANLLLNDFAERVFRRPLTEAERQRYGALFTNEYTEGNVNEGIQLAIEALLSSPHFLLRSEMGERVADIIDRIENGEAEFVPGDTRLSLSGAAIGATAEGEFRVIPLYNNFGTSLRDYTFTGNDLVTIEARGHFSAEAWSSMALRVDNQEVGTVVVDTEYVRPYQFLVRGVTGSGKYVQITNAINGAAHSTERNLDLLSVSFSNAVQVVPERPDPALDLDAYVLTPYELASFLAYTYTGSTPDRVLLDAAKNKALTSEAQIRAQIDRLLLTPRARVHFGEFAAQWLRSDRVLSATKDAERFPHFTLAVRQAMAREVREIFQHVMFDGAQPVQSLFDDFSFVNSTLAEFYGIEGNFGEQFTKVDNLLERGGLLTSGAFMAGFAHQDESSPIQRAVAVRERLLCHTVPPMPTDLEVAREDADEALAAFIASRGGVITNRERYAFLTKDAPCSDCHREIINPHGFGMEDFDAVGLLRTADVNQLPIDADGTLIGLASLSDGGEVPFNGARQLSQALMDLPAIEACFAEKSFRFVMGTGHKVFDHIAKDAPQLGTDEKAGYACALTAMQAAMNAANDTPRAALRALGSLDVVKYRKQR